MSGPSTWQRILPDVYLFRDSCNVYAAIGPKGALIVDAGTGAWLDHLDELPAPPTALACTHYFRDHSAGAARAAERGIPIYVPEGEWRVFRDPASHIAARETYITYENQWDHFVAIEGVPVAGLLRDHDRLELAGMEAEVLPLPGATATQAGLLLGLPQSQQRVAFVGETIHSPGRISRVAPLQYNYNDLGGALGVYLSAHGLRKSSPDALLPSLGEPILSKTDQALGALQQTLRTLCKNRPGMVELLDRVGRESLTKVTEHVYLSNIGVANTWLLLGESGKVMAIDYGYNSINIGAGWPGRPRPETRRALLHSIDAMKRELGRDRIDVVMLSHFHDDHTCGVPLLKRLFGAELWVPENFADLMERPDAHCFPCNWHAPMRVDRRLPLDQRVQWEQFTFHFAPMSGHTRFAALIGFEADGKRFAHTGDQYFFLKGVERFADNPVQRNFVFRNGALLDGYDQSLRWMLEWRPDVVIQGHQPAMITDEAFFAQLKAFSDEYRQVHAQAMPLGDQDEHFNLDSWGGWVWPYHQLVRPGETATARVTVRNPLPRAASIHVRLVGPSGWIGTDATLAAGARQEVGCDLTIRPSGPCRKRMFAVELTVEGRPFGQVAEGLLSVDSDPQDPHAWPADR
jgi:glyoxylase-like metal-dependent hydrolase (beta-lactamase superfamily II)